jgi:hypothetical protein
MISLMESARDFAPPLLFCCKLFIQAGCGRELLIDTAGSEVDASSDDIAAD